MSQPMDIIDFIKEKDYKIELGSWFKDIWVPLFEQKDVIITNKILNFIYDFQGDKNLTPYNLEKLYQNKRNYKLFLNKNEIEYNLIKYDEHTTNNYPILKNELKLYDKNNLVQKTWLVLSVDDFKESIMMLNNNNSKIIRKYYIKIEKILFDYFNYISEYNLTIEKNKIKKLEDSNMRMKVFIDKIVEKEKNGYIYIATSKSYANINNFKLGKTISLNSREINFNTSRNSQDEFYICYYKKVYNVDKVESLLKDVLDGFKDKKNKEIFIIHYKYLLELVEKTINNINEPYDYINDLIKNSLTDMYDLEPIIPNKIIKNEDKKMKYKDPVVYYINSKTNKCKGERILSSDLYKNYTAWCELYGIDNILSIISFSKDLIKKGYVKKKFTNGANFLDLRYKNKAL
ncbi:N1R/p28-like protein [Choristoneura rosaceana entomopoxvirus 'L']|uniref:N1R/p28-like protein n=1 Tax=Choristoneura rosaceana entomopoxvirus 'L' TaxID=1293539 RepID=A0ABM9QK31_9POXV|nr:N1R/p28-like protein [Choristoneura rosaceana entomopoxvirus 'L']YP_008004692.1 N1R/p28-like protein [Choristoneura rosaceana entomopoxvirus 'L']CCU55911.1 N1R/p28-like protein [Choristoneura rosaceana entomopoxvirus 'L']CCU56190.1 N1R/p28-like protein [Choristoneura rosaceana entomopoxvirus 'L']